jgi:4-hydroxy-tetrahydrodipicolinate reductase
VKNITVAVFGSSGRMGQEIVELLKISNNMELGLEINRQTKLQKASFQKIDVMIDFSLPTSFQKALKVAVANELPLVSGTTGLSVADQKAMKEASSKIPILWAPNMSLGVAVVTEALEVFRSLLDFDFQIEETHHRLKKDKPSGTALQLQKKLESVVQRKLPQPLALRGGGVFGVHQVHALGDNETIVFEHRALNRKLFADGALKAALWLVRQKKGLFELRDILNG